MKYRLCKTALEAIRSHFTIAEIDGLFEDLRIDGVEGWKCSHPDASLSLFRWTTTNLKCARKALNEVVAQMAPNNQKFTWLSDPQSKHLGFDDLLDDYGFELSHQVEVMAKNLSRTTVVRQSDNAAWHWEVPDQKSVARIISNAFKISEEVAAIFHRSYLEPSKFQATTIYGVSAPENDEVVAVGYLSYLTQTPAVLLRVAATLPQYRRLGLYRKLVRKRLEAATDEGYCTAYVHSYSADSANLLAMEGFKTVANLRLSIGPHKRLTKLVSYR